MVNILNRTLYINKNKNLLILFYQGKKKVKFGATLALAVHMETALR